MQLTSDQIHKFFETRLGRSLPHRDKVAVKCCFHDDGTASATVFLNGNGGFNCQSCQAKGNTFQFEMRFSKCSLEDAKRNIAEITGAELDKNGSKGPCTGVYDYRLANGSLAFQKRRYEPAGGKKTFSIVRQDEKGGWVSGLEGLPDRQRVLYNLPEVVTANLIFCVEGEKDCATLDALNLFPDRPDLRVASTTNFEGAWQQGHSPKWLSQYNSYFSGKRVIVFEDNDDSGRAWADHVASQIHPFAEQVRRVSFPDLSAKGDVTDWMETHTTEELRDRIVKAATWHPATSQQVRREVFISAALFAAHAEDEIEWLVHGVVQKGANGFFSAAPKSGKSWVSLDMLMSLAMGCKWMEFDVPRPVRCGLISREDGANLTAWRLKRLFGGKTGNPSDLERNLYINSRQQTPKFFLDCEEDVQEVVADIRRLQLEFVVLDVLNVLHCADENDNSEMTKVMAQVRKLNDLSGAAIGLVHHYSKNGEGTMSQRLRGAGAIGGFAEWQIGLSVVSEEEKVRRMEFETKAAEPHNAICFQIQSDKLSGISRIVRVDEPESQDKPVRRLKKV